jgi:ABC-type sugar transport system substrate-binding protein
MSKTVMFILAITLAGAGALVATSASAADAEQNGRVIRSRVAYRVYAPTPWRPDMREYHFNQENGGYEQEYKVGHCHVKRELEEDGDFNEEVHCQAHPD